MTRPAALVLLLAAACIPTEGPMMRPFEDCLSCHASGGDAKSWSVAGTWAKGVDISVQDANGKTVPMTANDAGNFYTAESLTFPLTVSVNGKVMKDSTTGAVILLQYDGRGASCNVCHRAETITVGEDMAPGSPCLTCHRVGGMASNHPFTAAGTFGPSQAVNIGGQTTTTRPASGNFHVNGPISRWPVSASIGGKAMERGAPHGDCNQCHGPGGSAGGD